ncbi:hypothetical protein D3C81_1197670 [compost metagenome]
MQVEDQQFVLLDALDPADEALLVDDELVDVHRRQVVGELHAVPGAAVVLAGLHGADAVPERAAQRVVAARQQVDVVDQLVGVVVLRRHPAGARLQAHVDVLGHQHHTLGVVATLQLHQLVDDAVVVEVFGQPGDRLGTLAHQDRQTTAGPALASLDRNPLLHFLRRGFAQHLVDQANRLAAFGGYGVLSGLELVQFLQHGHRDGDVVLLEVQQCVGVVDQNIGIEDIEGGLGRSGASMVIHTRVTSSLKVTTECHDSAPPRGEPPTLEEARERVQASDGPGPPPVCRVRRSTHQQIQEKL